MATSTNNSSGFAVLDPVQGLVEYVNDVKPFHTKIVEVLVEYVYQEDVDVRIIDKTHINVAIDRPATEAIAAACDGYDQIPYGDVKLPVLSNNINKQFDDQFDPAVNILTNTFKIRGDYTKSIKVGNKLNLVSYIENFERIHPLTGVITGHSGNASFEVANYVIKVDPIDNIAKPVIINKFEDDFSIGDRFLAVGTAEDDNRLYTVTQMVPHSTPYSYKDSIGNVHTGLTRTTVHVKEPIFSLGSNGFIGMTRTIHEQNTGSFTVAEVQYDGGMIDSWVDSTDPTTYKIGDEPHTIIKVQQRLGAPVYGPVHPDPVPPNSSTALFGIREVYSTFVQLAPVEVEQVLSFSNFRSYDVSPAPDEGIRSLPIKGCNKSQPNGVGGIIPGTGQFMVPYNVDLSNVFAGDKIRVSGSTANNGEYTITSFEYDDVTQLTVVSVHEKVRSDIADGALVIDIPSNVFVVDGNYTARFSQGKKFSIVGGTHNGTYTTLTSDFSNGKTRIRPTTNIVGNNGANRVKIAGMETIPDQTGTYENTPAIKILGNVTAKYSVGTTFNVYETVGNDGFYHVEYVTYVDYDAAGNFINATYVIPAIEIANVLTTYTLDTETFETGFVSLSNMGVIKDYLSGFGETSELVCMTTEGMVYTNIYENLKFSGITLDLRDEIITYNWENTDRNVFQNPLDTIISDTEPTVYEQATPPPTNDYVDVLWFDTTEHTLKQWIGNPANGGMWKSKTTVYWIDTTSNVLKYYTRVGSVNDLSQPVLDMNTGWQLYTEPAPGFSTVQSAQGSRAIIGKERFSVKLEQSGELTSTFVCASFTATISEVDTETPSSLGYFSAEGDVTGYISGIDFNYPLATKLIVSNSVNNDGQYTIAKVMYDSQQDATKFYVNESIVSSVLSGEITVGPMDIPLDENKVKVFVNDIPASFNILSAREFEIVDYPLLGYDDRVDLVIYDNILQESNAWVERFDSRPHSVFHPTIGNVPGHSAYEIPGGNFMYRFTPDHKFTIGYKTFVAHPDAGDSCEDFGFTTDPNITTSEDYNYVWLPDDEQRDYGSPLGDVFCGPTEPQEVTMFADMQATHFPVVDISTHNGTFTIEGQYDWLFTEGRILSIGTTSVNGYKNFEIVDSVFDGTHTTISVGFPNVIELPSGSPADPEHFNYGSTGIRIYNISNVQNIIQINSNQVGLPSTDPYGHIDNITHMFVVGDKIKITNSSEQLNGIWTVKNVAYDQGNGLTNIEVEENIAEADGSGNALLHPPVKDNQSANLNMMQYNNGYILGAVYDPRPISEHGDDARDINNPYKSVFFNQPRTIVVPKQTTVYSSAYSMSYDWFGPLRLEINLNPTTAIHSSIYDPLKIDGTTTVSPAFYEIIESNFAGQWIDVRPLATQSFYVLDPATSTYVYKDFPVDISDLYVAGAKFSIERSYADGNPNSLLTNDGQYIVLNSEYDYPATTNSTGITRIYIQNAFTSLPPYATFNVLGIANITGAPADQTEITLQGEVKDILIQNEIPDNGSVTYIIDQDLTGHEQFITVTAIREEGGNTIITVDEDIVNDTYTGPLNMVFDKYRPMLLVGDDTASGLWENGRIVNEQSQIEGLTATTFVEKLDFGWGVTHSWNIIDVRESDNSVYIEGDKTNTLALDDRVQLSTPFMDGDSLSNEVNALEYTGTMTRVQLDYPQVTLAARYIAEPNQWVGTPLRYDQIGGDEYIATGQYDVDPTIQRWATHEEIYGTAPKTWDVVNVDIENQKITINGLARILNDNYPGIDYIVVTADTQQNDISQLVTQAIDAGWIMGTPNDASDWNLLTDPVGSPGDVTGSPVGSPATWTTDYFRALDIISLRGSIGNDSDRYVIEAVEYDFVNDHTIFHLATLSDESLNELIVGKSLESVEVPGSPTIYGELTVRDIDVTNWYQYNIIIAKPKLGSPLVQHNAFIVNGNATLDIQSGQQFRVTGTSNDGVYTAGALVTNSESVYVDGDMNTVQTVVTTYVPVTELITNAERGGIIESVRDTGMNLVFEDRVGVRVGETAVGAMPTTGGNMVDAWDYPYWSIGGFDENLDTIVLYSNTL